MNKFGSTQHPILHTKFQGHRPFGSREDFFFRFLPYMGMVAILVSDLDHLTNFCSPIPWRLYMKFDFDWPSGFWEEDVQSEDHWSCIAHLSAEDMLKSAIIKEKKFKHSPWVGADNPLGPKFWCKQEGLITMVICCKFKKNLFNLWLYTHLFMIQ